MSTLSWPSRAVVCRKEGSTRLQHDIAGALGNGSWGYIVGTYDKDAGANNQRLYLNGARVAQVSGTLPIALNSAPLGIGRPAVPVERTCEAAHGHGQFTSGTTLRRRSAQLKKGGRAVIVTDWQGRHGLDAAAHQAGFDDLSGRGYRLAKITSYDAGGTPRYASIWHRQDGNPWRALHGVSEDRYQEAIDDWGPRATGPSTFPWSVQVA